MDLISGSKNIGSSAFGSSSSSSSSTGSDSGGGGMFSSFVNLSIQKMVLLLAVIAFIISVGTVAVLLWKSKSSQKWPPEIAKCPDRMVADANNKCIDPYGLFAQSDQTIIASNTATACSQFNTVKGKSYDSTLFASSDEKYLPWEGIVDGKDSRASNLKCLVS
jgi:hypothetical protein